MCTYALRSDGQDVFSLNSMIKVIGDDRENTQEMWSTSLTRLQNSTSMMLSVCTEPAPTTHGLAHTHPNNIMT